MSRIFFRCVCLLAVFGTPAESQDQNKDLKAIVSLGKKATALVQTERNRSGTAFCIDPAGWFVTNRLVFPGAKPGDQTKLVLNATEENEKTVNARIIRLDTETNLAILQAEGKKFATLPFGDVNDLVETNQVTAFGFPIIRLHPKREYPGVTVATARINALQKRDGKLKFIQFDKALHPGAAGGPVLNSLGQVIGIVREGTRYKPANTAIPVTELIRLIETPVIQFEAAPLDEDEGRNEQTFPVKVISLREPPSDRRVSLEIKYGDAKPTLFEAVRDNKGLYQVKATILPKTAGPEMLHIEITYDVGSVIGRTANIPVEVGNQTIPLGKIRRIESVKGQKPKVILDGKVLNGRVTVPRKAKIDFGGATIRLNFSKANTVNIKPIPRKPPTVSYRVLVRNGKKIVAEENGQFDIRLKDKAVANNDAKLSPVEIAPPTLNKDQSIVKLPAPIDNVAVGAGGRLLIFHLKKLQQLAVFDVSLAKVVKYLPLASNDISYAAGREKLFIGLRDIKVLQRYDLTTLEREITVDAPDGGISAMAIGAEATNPLIVLAMQSAKKSYLIDTTTMKAEPLHWKGWSGGAWGPVHVHASHDGSSAVACGGGWAGSEIVSLAGGKIVASTKGGYVRGRILVAGNGSLAFLDNNGGILRSDLANQVKGIEGTPFPAISSAYSLAFTKQDNQPVLTVFGNNDPKRLTTIRGVPELAEKSTLPIHHRAMLIPSAKVLITVGQGSDHLILRPFDLEQALQKEGIDYLFIESAPKRQAKKGATYEYSIKVRSRSGGLSFSLQAGPEGMTISKSGQLSWSVPENYLGKESPVIVQISDKSGQETFQTFRLKIVD